MAGDPIVGTDLTDGALKDEIELVGELVVVASASEGPLSEAEIDEALGMNAGTRGREARARGTPPRRRRTAVPGARAMRAAHAPRRWPGCGRLAAGCSVRPACARCTCGERWITRRTPTSP